MWMGKPTREELAAETRALTAMVRRMTDRPSLWPREEPGQPPAPPRNAAEAETQKLLAMVGRLTHRPLLWPRESR